MSRAAYEAWAKSKGIDATKIDGMERDDQCILLWSAWVGGMEFKPKQPPLEQDAMGIAMVAAWSIGGRTDAVHPDFQCGFEAGWEANQRATCETGCDPDLIYEAADEIERLRAQVTAAIPAMREYARENQKDYFDDTWQDPHGVHAWLSTNDCRAALDALDGNPCTTNRVDSQKQQKVANKWNSHLFELWWAEYVPNLGQMQAWNAFIAANHAFDDTPAIRLTPQEQP